MLDYVVVHELCHLREPNHSPRFWALVAERRPGWPVARDWLREHGEELLAFALEQPRLKSGRPRAISPLWTLSEGVVRRILPLNAAWLAARALRPRRARFAMFQVR